MATVQDVRIPEHPAGRYIHAEAKRRMLAVWRETDELHGEVEKILELHGSYSEPQPDYIRNVRQKLKEIEGEIWRYANTQY